MKKTIILVSIFGSLIICSFQLYKWQEFSFEATWLQIKSTTKTANINNLLRLGTLANSKNLLQESNEAFLNALNKDPLNSTAYANLAINNSKVKPYHKATPYFESYFSLGGNAKDVLHAYAQFQKLVKGPTFATKFYYQALNGALSKEQYLKDFYSNLVEINHHWPAISFIASIYQGDLSRSPYWLHRVQKDILKLSKSVTELELFASLRDDFYLPVKFNENQRYQFIKYDKNTKHFMLNTDFVKQHKLVLKKSEAPKKPSYFFSYNNIQKSLLAELSIGPFSLQDINVYVCDKCPNVMGSSLSKIFKINVSKKNDIESITLKK